MGIENKGVSINETSTTESALVNFFTLEFQQELINRAQCFGSNFEESLLSYAKLFLGELAIIFESDDEWLNKHSDIKNNYLASYHYPKTNGEGGVNISRLTALFHKILFSYHKWISMDSKSAIEYINEIIYPEEYSNNNVDKVMTYTDIKLFAEGDEKFYRGRFSKTRLQKSDMFHIPFKEAHKIRNQRFSLTGQPLLYLANSVDGVGYELSDNFYNYNVWTDFYVSQYARSKQNRGDNTEIKMYNLFIPNVDEVKSLLEVINDTNTFGFFMNRFVLSCVCSFPAMNKIGYFIEEYVIPQIVTQVIKENGYDGLCYVSTNFNIKKPYKNYALFTEKKCIDDAVDEVLRSKFEISNPITAKYAGDIEKNNICIEESLKHISYYFEWINEKNKVTLEKTEKLTRKIQDEYNSVFENGKSYIELDYKLKKGDETSEEI